MNRENEAPWNSDRELGLDAAAEIVGNQFPQLACREVRFLGAGWDSEAFEVDQRWIFRFPKRQEVVEHLETEFSILPRIAPRLPLTVPAPQFRGEPTARFPYPFMGYEKVAGAPLDELPASTLDVDAITHALLGFLEALHTIPLVGALARVRGWAAGEDLETRIRRLGLHREPLVESSLRRLKAELLPAPAARLVHDDLGMEHVLVDPLSSRVAGVIDWGDLNIDDPAHDFVGILDWVGLEPLREALARSSYPADPALLGRAQNGLIRNHLHNWCDGVEHDAAELRAGAQEALSEWTVA